MANTVNSDQAARATAGRGQGGNGSAGSNGRFGLRAQLAAGVAILGCAAALILGGMRAGHAAQPRAQVAPPATALPAGTDDLATTGCIGTAGPFGCQAGHALAGTDDFATTGCVGSAGPFACAQGQSLAGTDDLTPFGCMPVPGPFGCATAPPTATNGTDDLATNGCIGTVGPFGCATDPAGGYDPSAWPAHRDDARLDESPLLATTPPAPAVAEQPLSTTPA
jgi:hypothetical protein